MLSDLEMWSLLVGAFMPPLVALVNRSYWKPWLKGLVAVLSSVIAALVTVYLQGTFSGKGIVTCILIVLFTALGSYKIFWQPTNIAPKIEEATTPRS